MIIQIFTEKQFSFNFWTADPLNVVNPSFFSFFERSAYWSTIGGQ